MTIIFGLANSITELLIYRCIGMVLRLIVQSALTRTPQLVSSQPPLLLCTLSFVKLLVSFVKLEVSLLLISAEDSTNQAAAFPLYG